MAQYANCRRNCRRTKSVDRGCGFPAGPDDGMDGRHARADGSIVMQAKHYHGSGFAALKSKMAKERLSIDRLAATRYRPVTDREP